MRSAKAIIASLVAFFVTGGVVFGIVYVCLVYLIPQPNDWKTLRLNVYGALGFLASVAMGSMVGGYVMAYAVRRAQIVHSLVVIALLYGLHQAYIYWGPDTLWDQLFGPLLETVVACIPFFLLGACIANSCSKLMSLRS